MKPKVFLCGFMGAGKSSVGPILAGLLGGEFVDIDDLLTQLIRQRGGQTIAQYFAENGEAGFRKIENQVLQSLKTSKSQVIALGGGSLLNPLNFDLLSKLGILIYLSADLLELQRRLLSETQTRPLLKVGAGEDQSKKIRELFLQREPGYKKATIEILTTGKSIAQIADEIISRLQVQAGASVGH
jgi:shikimate kinase